MNIKEAEALIDFTKHWFKQIEYALDENCTRDALQLTLSASPIIDMMIERYNNQTGPIDIHEIISKVITELK